VSSLYIIYFGDDGVLAYATAFASTLVLTKAIIAMIQWNATTSEAVIFGNERHGISMSGASHMYNHLRNGSFWQDGMAIAGLSSGVATHGTLASGHYWDEDILHSPPAQTTLPFLWKIGSTWTEGTDDNNLGYVAGGDTYVSFNEDVGGGTFALTEITGVDFMIMFMIASNNYKPHFFKVLGEVEYSTVGQARDAIYSEKSTLNLGGLPPEFVFINAYIIARDGKLQLLDDGSTHLDLRATSDAAGAAGEPVSSFTSLTDTPANYASQAGRLPSVKADETSLIFDDTLFIDETNSQVIIGNSSTGNDGELVIYSTGIAMPTTTYSTSYQGDIHFDYPYNWNTDKAVGLSYSTNDYDHPVGGIFFGTESGTPPDNGSTISFLVSGSYVAGSKLTFKLGGDFSGNFYGDLNVAEDLAVDTDTFVVDATNDRVGVNNASPSVDLDVTGEVAISGDVAVDTDTFVVDATNDRVGVNSANPEYDIDTGTGYGTYAGAKAAKKLSLYNSGGGSFYGMGVSIDTAEFHANSGATGLPGMVLRSDGNVGIGVVAPTRTLEVNDGSNTVFYADDTRLYYKGIGTTYNVRSDLHTAYNKESGNYWNYFAFQYAAAGLIAMGMDSGRNFFAGNYNVSWGAGLVLAWTDKRCRFPYNYNVAVGSTNHDCYMDNSGYVGKTSSSERYKENIKDLDRESEFIYDLRPVDFNFIKDGAHGQGLIAEEVAEVDGRCDNLLSYDEQDRPDSVNYSRLIPLLLNELQKLNTRVEELEDELGKVKKPKKNYPKKIKENKPPYSEPEPQPEPPVPEDM